MEDRNEIALMFFKQETRKGKDMTHDEIANAALDILLTLGDFNISESEMECFADDIKDLLDPYVSIKLGARDHFTTTIDDLEIRVEDEDGMIVIEADGNEIGHVVYRELVG